METKTNAFGETVTRWTNTTHPDNATYMQRVIWTMWERPDGRVTVCYRLDYNGKPVFLHGLTKSEILTKYGNNNRKGDA